MDTDALFNELNFKASRSSGPGGQHVNKVSSKISLSFDIQASKILSGRQKELLLKNLSSKLTKENMLTIECSDNRSQHRNKEIAVKRFFEILKKSLIVPKKRKATRPSKASVKKRLEKKKKQAYKKALRKKQDF